MTHSPTIRLFVSSTFSDLKAERDALQREVFPRLKQLCLSKGLRFQAIDLRWGISEEAGLEVYRPAQRVRHSHAKTHSSHGHVRAKSAQ
ncbi:MAG: hypothetical protein WC378_00425 [Opitutaceae bacterium]|jgi:hypothetical protein